MKKRFRLGLLPLALAGASRSHARTLQSIDEVISRFFGYLRMELGQARLPADLFGLSTLKQDELGVGQLIEDAYRYFDYACPSPLFLRF